MNTFWDREEYFLPRACENPRYDTYRYDEVCLYLASGHITSGDITVCKSKLKKVKTRL